MKSSFLVVFALILASCASRVSRCEKEVVSYRQGREANVEEKNFPIGAYTENSEAARLLLDRGLIRLQQGEAKKALEDFCTAIDAIDYYRSTLLQEKAMQLLIDDKRSAYIAKPYEAVFARLYAAFACYELRQNDHAFIFLKQAIAFEDLQREQGQQKTSSPLLSYLMALHLERCKDFSQAALFYRRAYASCPYKFIQSDLARVEEGRSSQATVLWIAHQGVIPEKHSIIAPASIASAAAVEMLLAAWNIKPALSSLSGIALPAFVDGPPLCAPAPLTLNHRRYAASKIEDLFAYAKADLESEIPSLAAQAAARALLRRATVGAVREKNALAGDLADLFAFAANLATKADTRMWKTLPQEIYFLRIDLPPGVYEIEGETRILKSGDLLVLQEFILP